MFPPIRSILTAVFMFVITATTVSAQTDSITLAWDPNDPSEQVVEYRLYYKTGTSGPPYNGTGLNPEGSPIIIRVADLADQNNPRYSLTGLTAGVTYRFATTAYADNHPESRYSNEVSYSFQEPVELDHIAIAGPGSVDENSSANYNCRAYYTDGSNELVAATSWSETCPGTNISSNGLLTTGEVTADTSCMVSATYTSGGITRSDGMNITIANTNIVMLDHIEITGPGRLNENSSANYNCIAHFTDGSNVQVAATSWSETCPGTNISSNGLLTTGEVTADTSCMVSATYTSGGITRSDGMNITIANTNIVMLDHIEITGPGRLNENSSANYNCIAYYTDGSNVQVAATSWSETCPGTNISSNGLLTTGEVNGDTPCTVSATYTSEGITQSDEITITIANTNIVMLDHIEITGPGHVDEKSIAYYNCIAYYTDGSNEQVTAESWSDTCPGPNVSSDGLLTTGEITGDTPCTVSATYTSESITRSDEINITIENTNKDKKTNNLYILPILDLLL